MGEYVQLGDVRTWYAEHGKGDPLVLMHGGLVDARFFEPNLDALAEHFRVLTPERRGHGHTPDVEGPITYELMAEETIAFLETVVGGPADLVGHSDGAISALIAAVRRPDLVNRLVVMSGAYDKSGEAESGGDVDVAEVTDFLGPAYGEVSPDGEAHFPVVAEKIRVMADDPWGIPAEQLRTITARTLLVAADDDIWTLPHTLEMYDLIRNAELAVVPGTSHFLTQEKPELVNRIVVDFLTREPVPLTAPIRRAEEPEAEPA